jgi:hypothetical protein
MLCAPRFTFGRIFLHTRRNLSRFPGLDAHPYRGSGCDRPNGQPRETTGARIVSAAAPALAKPEPEIGDFTKLPHWFFDHLPRITYSQTEIWMVLWVWRMTQGKERKRGEKVPYWTPITPAREIARICHCTEKAIEDTGKKTCWDEGEEGPGRGVLLRKKIGRTYVYHCRIEAWEDIEGREIPAPKKPPQSAESAGENEEDETDNNDEETANNRSTELRVFKHPQVFRGKDRCGRKEELAHAARYVRPEGRNCTIDVILKGDELRVIAVGIAESARNLAPSSSGRYIKDGLNGHAPPESSPPRRKSNFENALDEALRRRGVTSP